MSTVEVGSSPAPAPAVEEKPKEDGEDFEGLAAVLEHLGLSDFKTTFEDEQIDLESFVRKKSAMYSTLGSVSCVLNVLYKSTLPAYLDRHRTAHVHHYRTSCLISSQEEDCMSC